VTAVIALLKWMATGWTWRRAANVGTLVLALANAIISYDALAAAAQAAGLHGLFSWLFPLATDGIIGVATPAQLALRRSEAPRWVRSQIGIMLWAAIIFSVVGNASRASALWSGVTLYVVPLPTWSAVWLALPPLAYAGALHVLGLVHQYPPAGEADVEAEATRLREELGEARRAVARLRSELEGKSRPSSRDEDGDRATRRLPASEVRELVRAARAQLIDELVREPSGEEVAARVTADGYEIKAPRVRSYLAEVRAEERSHQATGEASVEKEVVAWHAR
jgi:Protein of unknown function (DUF2637)